MNVLALKKFLITWMGEWRADNGTYVGPNSPIRTGGTPGYNSFIGIDKQGILNAINTSKTTPIILLWLYVTDSGNFDIGFHKETYNKETNGIPFYRYGGISKFYYSTTWRSFDLTNAQLSVEGTTGFKNILNAGYTGIVVYGAVGSDQGEAIGYTNGSTHAYIEVQGTWNTPPGKPSIIQPTTGYVVDGVYELKGNPATDAEQSASELRYEWRINDGTGWHDLGFGDYGVVNRLVDFSQYQESNGARVGLRANDGELTGDWAYSGYFTILHNKPPSAPTNLSPTGGAQIDRTKDTVFTWKHNDADAQSAFDFQWRLQGETQWNSSYVVSTDSVFVVPANTFPDGIIEWTVRTYDQEGEVGPFATNSIIDAAEPTTAPTITRPLNEDTVATSKVIVSWSTLNQDNYEMQLVKDEQVIWSENVRSTIRTRQIPFELENNTTYTINLRVDTDEELPSEWATVNFVTSFTTPSTPIVEPNGLDDTASIVLEITNPIAGTEGEPTVLRNEVFRRKSGSGNDFIRIADNVEKNGTFIDYTPASGVQYEYLVRAIGENDTTNDSSVVIGEIEIKDTLLSLASNPSKFVRLKWNPSRLINRKMEINLMQFNGRKYPVAEFGEANNDSIPLSFDIRNDYTLQKLRDIWEEKEAILIRDSRGKREFVTIDSIIIQDKFPNGYIISFTGNIVDYEEEV